MKFILLHLFSIFSLISFIISFDIRNGISRPWNLISRNKQVYLPKIKINNLLKSILRTSFSHHIKSHIPEYKELFVTTKLDHFSFDNSETFEMRILINEEHYQKGGPILFYCGNEGKIETFWDSAGFLTSDLANEFKGIVVFAEHRFFGKSFPKGQTKQDYDIKKNKYLTVEQTLADFTVFLQSFIKEEKFSYSPVIAFGGSYGGMLAAWGRMKFPHVFAGAVASSAPILLFEDINKISNNFFKIVTNTYKRYDTNCPIKIREGFEALISVEKAIKNDNLIKEINDLFIPCNKIKNKDDIQKLQNTLEDAIVFLAQYNYPYDFGFDGVTLPGTPVKVACDRIKLGIEEEDPFKFLTEVEDFTLRKYNLMDKTLKQKLINLKIAGDVFFNNTGSQKCLDIGNVPSNSTDINGWEYLACTEMIMPMQKDGVTDMFNPSKWNLNNFTNECNLKWSADVRPEWAFNFFGGRNFEKESKSYSNIFFINGKMDPWNAGCPQKSNNPSVLVYLADSAHHLDLRSPNANDPASITEARFIMKKLITKWILEFVNNNSR